MAAEPEREDGVRDVVGDPDALQEGWRALLQIAGLPAGQERVQRDQQGLDSRLARPGSELAASSRSVGQ